jgi:hypothetical protein
MSYSSLDRSQPFTRARVSLDSSPSHPLPPPPLPSAAVAFRAVCRSHRCPSRRRRFPPRAFALAPRPCIPVRRRIPAPAPAPAPAQQPPPSPAARARAPPLTCARAPPRRRRHHSAAHAPKCRRQCCSTPSPARPAAPPRLLPHTRRRITPLSRRALFR